MGNRQLRGVGLDPEKVKFLFGKVPDGFDVDDPAQREALLAPAGEDDPSLRVQGLVRAAVANQIADDDPPETWLTARRLLALGLDREKVMREMALVMSAQIAAAGDPEERLFDDDEYLRALAELPLPQAEDIRETFVALARAHHPVDSEELDQMVAEKFHRRPDDPIMQRLLDVVADQLVVDGTLEFLADDRVVYLPDLTANMVMTHRLSWEEVETESIDGAIDLAPFARRSELRVEDGEVLMFGRRWGLPAGGLGGLTEGRMIAVRVGADGLAKIDPLDAPPAGDPALVERFRRAYDLLVEEPEVPALAEEIVFELVADDRTLFDRPQPPLADLCREAGLEVRGAMAAHEDRLWENQREIELLHRVWDVFEDDKESSDAVLFILALAPQAGPGRADLKRALNSLADEQIAEFVVDELFFGEMPDEDRVASVQEFASALIRAAGEGMPKVVAHWFAALIAERAEEPLVADAHLQVALTAGRDWPPVLERAAWYASDRGDAAAALGLLRRMPDPPRHALMTLGEFEGAAQPDIGRNEPCWCGSGRKFKNCHLRQPQGHPLPERVGWLCFKAVWYLEHQGQDPLEEVMHLAGVRAADPEDNESVTKALEDPILMDLVLTERGWFGDFVRARGSLLPEDELLLAQSWLLVDRTVYEVETVRPGIGLTVRDLATGERVEVREKTFSRKAQKGWMICARAVPDGETNQFVGGIFSVQPGTEETVLDMCIDGDGEALAAWVGALERPPRIVTPEGEPIEPRTPLPNLAGVEALGDPDPGETGQIQEQMEDRWMNEPVPALAGLTPREAAADPTRREQLERLLASFEQMGPLSPGMFTFRVDRLRRELGM